MSNRRIPEWLLPVNTENIQNDDKRVEINLNINNAKNMERRILRSQSSTSKPIYVRKELPFIDFKGSIQYLTDSLDIACAAAQLLSWVELQEDPIVPIAFDMEWPFSFQRGAGKTSVMQLCAIEDTCYVFHIFNLKNIPAALSALLTHTKVRLHGVNIKNDFRKLERDFPEIGAEKIETMIKQCVDLGPWCNTVHNTAGRWSLARLVHFICKQRIDKNKKVRMSNWHIAPLKKEQKLYAAIDVYISQVIYRKLEKMEQQKEEQSVNRALASIDMNF